MVPFNIFCGSCCFCARGLYSNCHNVNPNATAVGGIYGYSHTCGGYDGGQAEFVRVPFADVGPAIDPGLDGRRGRRAAHRRAGHRLLRRAARRHRRGRHRRRVRRRPGGAVRREVGLADGRRPRDRRSTTSSTGWRRRATFAHAETLNFTEYDDIVVDDEEDDRLPRRRRRRSTRSAPRPTATSCSTSPRRSSSCRAAPRSR